jgi:ParB family chromosome partitioning protein
VTNSRKGGLGRGLAALIPTGPASGSATVAERLAHLHRPAPSVRPPARPAPPEDADELDEDLAELDEDLTGLDENLAGESGAGDATTDQRRPRERGVSRETSPTSASAGRRHGATEPDAPSRVSRETSRYSGTRPRVDPRRGDEYDEYDEPADVSRETSARTRRGGTAGRGGTAEGEPHDEIDVSRETSIGAVYRELSVDCIRPNPRQPRQVFDEQALAELAHSIREFGLLQPIIVRELGVGSWYELVAGERRWRAAMQAGMAVIPAIVRQTPNDAMLRDALLENIHRVQLNPLEEAAAYQQLLQEFDVTHEELADRLGRSRPAITNMIRLLRLPLPVQRRVAAGVLSAGHARALLGLDDAGAQEDLAARIVAEGLSVRATEEAVLLTRGTGPSRPKPAPRKPMQAPGLQHLAERLSDAFDTRVKVELGRRKGRIVVEFGSVDDLERIVAIMQTTAPPGTQHA